jgi:hypothetical protein
MEPSYFEDKRTQTERDQDNDIIRLMRALDDITADHNGRLAGGDREVLCARLKHVLALVRGK